MRQDPDPRFRRAVHPADRAPRPRAAGLLRDPSLRRRLTASSASSRRAGIILSGGPASAYEGDDAARAAGGVRARRPGARHLLRHADDGRSSSAARSRARQGARVRLRRGARARTLASCSTASQDRANGERPRPARRLDEPRRQGDELPPGFKLMARPTPARSPAWPTSAPASTACSSTPRSRTRSRAGRSCSTSSRHLRLRAATGPCPTSSTRRSSASARRSASEEVICGLSGGVDSSVAAALIHRAIGDQLTCIFVDNGLLRQNEAEQVMDDLPRHLGVQGRSMSTPRDRFLRALAGVTDPEEKRKIIGRAVHRRLPARRRRSCRRRSGSRRARSTPT